MKRSVRRAVQPLLMSGFVLATALALAPNALAAGSPPAGGAAIGQVIAATLGATVATFALRSEEHTSELQSQSNLVCRLLLENNEDAILDAARLRPVRT